MDVLRGNPIHIFYFILIKKNLFKGREEEGEGQRESQENFALGIEADRGRHPRTLRS